MPQFSAPHIEQMAQGAQPSNGTGQPEQQFIKPLPAGHTNPWHVEWVKTPYGFGHVEHFDCF